VQEEQTDHKEQGSGALDQQWLVANGVLKIFLN